MGDRYDFPMSGVIASAGVLIMSSAVSVLSVNHGSSYDILDKIADDLYKEEISVCNSSFFRTSAS